MPDPDFRLHPYFDERVSHPYEGMVPDQMYVDLRDFIGSAQEWYDANRKMQLMQQEAAQQERFDAALAAGLIASGQQTMPAILNMSAEARAVYREDLIRKVGEVSTTMADICLLGFDVEDAILEHRNTLERGNELANLLVKLSDGEMTQFGGYLAILTSFYNRRYSDTLVEPWNAVPLFRPFYTENYLVANPAIDALVYYDSPDGPVSKRRARGDNLGHLAMNLAYLYENALQEMRRSSFHRDASYVCQDRASRMNSALVNSLTKRAG